MGVELVILGIRKIRDGEVKALTGKTWEETEDSEYHRKLFPLAPDNSGYWRYAENEISGMQDSIREMLTPVRDADGVTGYVFWAEELGYYWHKNPRDREQIDMLLEDIMDLMDWDQEFHVVPYEKISRYTHHSPSVEDGKEEIVAFLYG